MTARSSGSRRSRSRMRGAKRNIRFLRFKSASLGPDDEIQRRRTSGQPGPAPVPPTDDAVGTQLPAKRGRWVNTRRVRTSHYMLRPRAVEARHGKGAAHAGPLELGSHGAVRDDARGVQRRVRSRRDGRRGRQRRDRGQPHGPGVVGGRWGRGARRDDHRRCRSPRCDGGRDWRRDRDDGRRDRLGGGGRRAAFRVSDRGPAVQRGVRPE